MNGLLYFVKVYTFELTVMGIGFLMSAICFLLSFNKEIESWKKKNKLFKIFKPLPELGEIFLALGTSYFIVVVIKVIFRMIFL